MCLRISSTLAGLAVLAGCGAAESVPPPGDEVVCAIGAGEALSPVCTLERVGNDVILHHPGGGFRRLTRDPATRALAPRDGAEVLVPEQGGAGVEAFAIGADRYLIPRTLLDPPQK